MKTKLLLFLIFALSIYTTHAQTTFTSNGITYTVSGTNTVAATDYTGSSFFVTIPNTVTNNSVTYSVTSIGEDAFYSESLRSLTIQASLISIGNNAFFNNSINSIVLPNSLITIGDNAFSNNLIASIVIPESVTSIGDGAFKSNSLTSIVIPNNVTSVGSGAFTSNGIKTVTIGNSVSSIGNTAFNTNDLTRVISKSTSPATLSNISYVFNYSTNANIDLEIPAGSNMAYTNAGWTGFKSVSDITPAVGDTFISNNIFYKITSITNNTLTTTDYHTAGGTDVVIPSTVVYDGITYTVTSIDRNSFSYNNLTSVVIPDTVLTIGNYAFEEDFNLTSIIIGNSVTTIGFGAFYNTSITSIIIPASVTSISANAFNTDDTLTSVVSKSTNPAVLASNVFDNIGAVDLTIPTGTSQAYTNASWTGFKSITESTTLGSTAIEGSESSLLITTDSQYLNVLTDKGAVTKIYSITGALVKTSNQNKIDISSLVAGIYVAHVYTKEGGVFIQKVLKK